MEYIKSFLVNKENINHRWISVLILFIDDGRTVLDKGYVFIGDMAINCMGNYINFTNFNIINGHLYYTYQNGSTKYVEPNKVHLHFKFGQIPFELTVDNPNYWNLFFSSPDSKIYKSISSYLDHEHIHILKLVEHIPSKKRLTPSTITHPLFSTKQIYGIHMDQVILSGINISMF